MNMVIKKRQLIMATLVLALGAAIFINWYYTNPKTELAGANEQTTASQGATQINADDDTLGDAQYVNSTNVAESEFFADARLKRTVAHDESLEALNDIIKDSSSNSDAIKKASESLESISAAIKLEADIEALITAKTGSACLVVINGQKAEAIVEKGILNNATVLQIKEIILKQTKISSENITIVELNG